MALTAGDVALSQILEGVRERGETIRVGLIGNTRVGKTHTAERILAGWLKASTGTLFVLDPKANHRMDFLLRNLPPEERARETPAHLARKPYPPGCRVVIARARIFEGQALDADEWQKVPWSLAGRRLPSLTYCDEAVPDMAEYGQFVGGKGSATKRNFIQGGEHGISQVFATTDLDQVPIAMMASCSHLCVFQTAGTGKLLLGRRNYLIGEPPTERLAGIERPPAERGEFVLLRSGIPWDGRVYKF